MQADDKKTIGLTPANQEILEAVMETGAFDKEYDAAKFAVSLAINAGIEPNNAEGAETKWSVITFGMEISDIVSLLVPECETPYRLIEYYMNVGLGIIGAHMKGNNGQLDITQLLDTGLRA